MLLLLIQINPQVKLNYLHLNEDNNKKNSF